MQPMSRLKDGLIPAHAVIISHHNGPPTDRRVVAIDLAAISIGYPLLWLSRLVGVPYADMLAAYERWVEWGRDWAEHVDSQTTWIKRWGIVLTEAFAVLTREGILLHPSIMPLRRPAFPS